MHGLTQLGLMHTLVAAAIAFARDKGIDPANTLGELYLRTTILACMTRIGIFKHGGFDEQPVPGIAAL